MNDLVNSPAHYRTDAGLEAIDVIEAFGLNYRLGNVIKYVLRAARKGEMKQDLSKARWYLDREIGDGEAKSPRETHLTDFPLCYLATPYSKYPYGMLEAFRMAAFLTANLIKQGVKVYSPIAHTHPVAVHGGIDPTDHKIWLPFDEAMMSVSSALIVAHMASWDTSYGIKHEIEYFENDRKPIFDLNIGTMVATRRSRRKITDDDSPTRERDERVPNLLR